MKLGWWPSRAGNPTGPDATYLKRTIQDANRWLIAHLYEASGDDVADTGAGGTVNEITWSAATGVDEAKLNADNDTSIRVPTDHAKWLVEGVWSATYTVPSAAGVRFGWRVNGTDTRMSNRTYSQAAGSSELEAVFSRVVDGGDSITAYVVVGVASGSISDPYLTLKMTPVNG